MQYFFTSATLVAAAVLSSAAPAKHEPRRGFTVTQVFAGHVHKSGPLALQHTYKKYAHLGAVAPPHVRVAAASAAAAVQTGSVAANPASFDASYLSPVSIGNQTLNLDFDTGSSDLWVFSTLLNASQVNGQHLYNASKSTTSSLLTNYTWSVGYGDNSGASGVVYKDKVVIGGVTATSQAVEAATSVSSSFTSSSGTDGLVGLAFSSLNQVRPQQQLTFFDSIKSTLPSALFAATLKKGQPGTYDFGYINSTRYKAPILYTAINNNPGYWTFQAGNYSIGNSSAAYSTTALGSVIADTGTTFVLLPSNVVTAYYAKVNGSAYNSAYGAYTYPCASALPNFNVQVGGGVTTLPSSYVTYGPINSTHCYGGIQANTGLNGLILFGDIYLKSQYVVFDQSQSTPRIGFAPQA